MKIAVSKFSVVSTSKPVLSTLPNYKGSEMLVVFFNAQTFILLFLSDECIRC